ncbi:hypothetical protein Dimus_021695 [Dionaea muscipula]
MANSVWYNRQHGFEETEGERRSRERGGPERGSFATSMAISRPWLLILEVCLFISSSVLITGVDAMSDFQYPFTSLQVTRSVCQDGSSADCLVADDDEEFQLDSEINRRILATSRYISYAALDKNSIPCSRRGISYYNCLAGASANPYNRGCSAITRCRG